MLRHRGLGNSSTMLEKTVREQHCDSWMRRATHYLTDCQVFVQVKKSGLLTCPKFEEPPEMPAVPKYKWFTQVYCQDVMSRVEEVKASITSTFGRVLKIDSTKKVVKKLAGKDGKTASWCTNVGNEYGQVLISVLTAGEGCGLEPMIKGIIRRYEAADVSPPELLYTDRDCCGGTKLRSVFSSAWPKLFIRLDIWHFMRRLASACTTESHPLYAIFMGRLSSSIFEWSGEDLENLREAKRNELIAMGVENPTIDAVNMRISKYEMALHCRRRTRGAKTTTELLHATLELFDSDAGRDTLRVPLLDNKRIWDIWESQLKHISCIQDPGDIQLYTKTGEIRKGDILLPTYRCARGSTSLESFHLHINRFIPGDSASGTHFQAYLLDGLVRWNQNRATEAISEQPKSAQHSYSGLFRHSLNVLGTGVLGHKLFPDYTAPRKYTGELIGIEYLYSQTGQVLQDMVTDFDCPGISQEPDVEEPASKDDEGFIDIEDMTIEGASCDSFIMRTRHRRKLPDPDRDDELASEKSKPKGSSGVKHSAPRDLERTPESNKELKAPPETVSSPKGEDDEVSLGPDAIPGYDKVQALAEAMLVLRTSLGAITNTQAQLIITSWHELEDFDKRPVVFERRYSTKKSVGRFKSPKKTSSCVPGVETTKKSFRGDNVGPAGKPDCNRYTEALVLKLCRIHPSPIRTKGSYQERFTPIARDYKHIKDIVMGHPLITEGCNIQLPDLNNTTLKNWYNHRSDKLEKVVYAHGTSYRCEQTTEAINALPPAIDKPTSLPHAPAVENQHVFNLPEITTGQANVRVKQKETTLTTSQTLVPEIAPRPFVLMVNPDQHNILSRIDSTSPMAHSIPRSTKYYRKRKLELTGEASKTYTKRTTSKCCSLCKETITPDSGHSFYYGNRFCPKMEESLEDWLKRMKHRGYRRKGNDDQM